VVVDNEGTVLGRNDYYPFGKLWESDNIQAPTTRYLFSGKEKQTIRDLGWLDFSARMYANCEIPLFTTPDPLMEKYYSISPYVYCANNPLRYIDPNGMMFDGYLMDKKGYILPIPINNEGGDKYDVIYNAEDYMAGKRDYDESGDKSGIQINKGEVQNIEIGKSVKVKSFESSTIIGSRREDKYEVTSDSKAQSIMNFVEKNTTVEAGNTYAEKDNGEKVNLILTSHESGTVRNGIVSNLEKYLGAGHTVIRDDHIHPRQYTGDNSNPSGTSGDMGRAKQILQYSPKAQFRILNNGVYYPYNQYGKIKK
jgi:RHS repeat-associated protein